MKNKKGCTPNNRYKHAEVGGAASGVTDHNLNISDISLNMETNQSEIMLMDEIFSDRRLTTTCQNENNKPTPVAQIDIYNLEKV
jgi:hypothetical protein